MSVDDYGNVDAMTNQPKPAPTAEEQLPPRDIIEDDKVKAERARTLVNPKWLTADCFPEYHYFERQLRAALRSNREKDAEADKAAEMFKSVISAQQENTDVLLGQLAEKDAKVAELGKESERHLTQAHNAEGHAVYQTRRAEAKLRAVSEAMNDPYDVNAPWAKVARIRAIVEGK